MKCSILTLATFIVASSSTPIIAQNITANNIVYSASRAQCKFKPIERLTMFNAKGTIYCPGVFDRENPEEYTLEPTLELAEQYMEVIPSKMLTNALHELHTKSPHFR